MTTKSLEFWKCRKWGKILILNHIQWILKDDDEEEKDVFSNAKPKVYGEQKFENFSLGWVMAGDVNF